MTRPENTSAEARFAALYRTYRPQVLAYCRRRLPEADAAEAVSDVFIAVWRHLDRVPDDPLPWLYGLARNAVFNHRRRAKRWLRLHGRALSTHTVDEVRDPAALTEASATVRTAWRGLSEHDRETLRLAGWEGLSGAELAVALDCSPQAARVRLHRARRRFGVLLTDADSLHPPAGPARDRPRPARGDLA